MQNEGGQESGMEWREEKKKQRGRNVVVDGVAVGRRIE